MASDSLRFLNLTDSDDANVPCTCDILDKQRGIHTYVTYMLDKTNQMFTYDGLPETIPQEFLELFLQVYGGVGIVEHKGDLYALYGKPAGPPDPIYRRTAFIIANVAIPEAGKMYKIVNHMPPYNKAFWDSMPPCVYMRNDMRSEGLLPIFSRYATQMVENDVSIRSAQINSRQVVHISATNGPEIESAQQYVKDLEAGKIGITSERPFLDGIKVQNVSTMSSNSIIQLIELQQYLKASWYNELGLNTSFNMKREYLSSEEIKASTDILLPLVDNMLYCRQLGVDAINKQWGTNISVTKNSAWQNKQEESDMRLTPEGAVDADSVEKDESPAQDESKGGDSE